MTDQMIATQTRAGAFDTVPEADRAIRDLRAAGFATRQLAVICPATYKEHFRQEAPEAETAGTGPAAALVLGSAVGATLGGLALAATVLTGGVAGAAAAGVLIGGGAIAGGFSSLVMTKGYEEETDDHYKQAIERGQIVVGVEAMGEDIPRQLDDARRILDQAAAKELWPA